MHSPSNRPKIAVIVGAGPAGLTAAFELLNKTNIVPMVFEADSQVGGISKTIDYRGNRMDLGGHRFFSKSQWVMRWWQNILPIAEAADESKDDIRIHYQGRSASVLPVSVAAASPDGVLLVRKRLSRIFYKRKFFDYPLRLNFDTLRNLGWVEALRIGLSYAYAKLRTGKPATSLEDFLIDRFGSRLYRTFFKDYTEKVWGVPCTEISAEWGAQRIKGLSVAKALGHALTSPFRKSGHSDQKGTETSLIEQFLYPTLGPGQMWEAVAARVSAGGARIQLRHRVVGIERKDATITAVSVRNETDQSVIRIPCDYLISTMPVRELMVFLQPEQPRIQALADGLPYRDFVTVGLLVKRMNTPRGGSQAGSNGMPPDNWIYIQEPDVKIGRLQIFNNWSPALVADPGTIWLGLEYFCAMGDGLWSLSDTEFIDFATAELEKLGLIERRDVLDATLVRVPRAYPAYFGTYSNFDEIRDYLDRFVNLYPIGRNGMHRYNNQDHSMLSANAAVAAILDSGRGKAAIWQINAEDDYHESLCES